MGMNIKIATQFYETYDATGFIIGKIITQIQGHYFICQLTSITSRRYSAAHVGGRLRGLR